MCSCMVEMMCGGRWWSVVVGGRIDRIIGSRRNGGKKWSETLLDQISTDEKQTLSQDYFFRPLLEGRVRSGEAIER